MREDWDDCADPGEIWASKAPYGWSRCEDCGEEWEWGEECACVCHKEEE